MNSEQSRATTYRWIGRIAGVLMTTLALVIGIGEALDGPRRHPGVTLLGQFTPLVLVMFAVWGVGLAGLLLGWWKERVGGILSLCCFALVFVLNLFNSQAPPAMRILALIPMGFYCIPSVAFIASWRLRSRAGQPPR